MVIMKLISLLVLFCKSNKKNWSPHRIKGENVDCFSVKEEKGVDNDVVMNWRAR